jgi:hydroxymethylpyrimidine/phosphomethylpyrimidine kinase
VSLSFALTIAGSDPSGGAGLQADLKTFHQFGAYGAAAVALVTVQNSRGVERVDVLDATLVEAQARAVLCDMHVDAVKTGALGSAEIVRAVARLQREYGFPLVVDPVMLATHGAALLAASAREALLEELLPCATLVTPNLAEAAALTGLAVYDLATMLVAARALHDRTHASVLVKGGHLAGDAVDVFWDGAESQEFRAPRVASRHTHGTGCTYSAAIVAGLAQRMSLIDAIARAKRYITAAIATAPGLGAGRGPLNHFAESAE